MSLAEGNLDRVRSCVSSRLRRVAVPAWDLKQGLTAGRRPAEVPATTAGRSGGGAAMVYVCVHVCARACVCVCAACLPGFMCGASWTTLQSVHLLGGACHVHRA